MSGSILGRRGGAVRDTLQHMRVFCSLIFVLVACGEAVPAPVAPQPWRPQPDAASAGPAQALPTLPQSVGPATAVDSGDPYAAARKECLDETNAYRARLGAAALTARPDKAACSDTDARGDGTNGTVHGESGNCGLLAQNECPSWPGTASGIVSACLKSMFDEGPGEPYSAHGHWINMTNKSYHSLACGFYEKGGRVWLVQNYFP